MAATLGGPRLRLRVRFADEVGRHVLRHRGFSSCWFLVPSDARIVGDLAFALVQEFDLSARCPAGVDLSIDGLHVPANQDIEVVRDNDAVTVQCASLLEPSPSPAPKRRRRFRELGDDDGSLTIPLSPSLSSGDEGDTGEEGEEADLRRMMQHLRSQRLALQRKGKAPKKTKAAKRLKIKAAAKTKPGKEKIKKKTTLVTTAPSDSSSDSNDSDSSSSNSSSSSSSSDSDSDSSSLSSSDEDTTSTNRGVKTPTVNRTSGTSQSAGGSKLKELAQSNGGSKSGEEAGEADAGEQKPRRQRRRQRRRRRDRNTSAKAVQDEVTNSGAPATATGAANGTGAKTSIASVAEPRREIQTRFPQSKAHFRFDGVNGEADVLFNIRQTPAGLEKYGPSSSDAAFANGGPSTEEATTGDSGRFNGANAGQRRRRQPGGDAGNASDGGSGFAPQRKKAKTHRDEMWKRPYEVLATVLDKPQVDNAANKADLTALLAVYPSPSAEELGASSFQSDDIVAFKTLRLCMETCQPIVSEWQCGKVVTIDCGAGVTLEMRKLTVNDKGSEPSVHFDYVLIGDEATKEVPVSEFSELRYLSGPTFKALRNARGDQSAQ